MILREITELVQSNELDQALEQIRLLTKPEEIVFGKMLRSRIAEKQGDLNWAFNLADEALEEILHYNDPLLISEGYRTLSNVLIRLGKFDEAKNELEKAENTLLAITTRDDKFFYVFGRIYLSLGYVNDVLGNLQISMNYYLSILKQQRLHEDSYLIGHAYNNIGEIHRMRGELRESANFYKKSLLVREQIDDQRGIAVCLTNLGVVHDRLGDNFDAVQHIKNAYELFQELNNPYDTGECLYHYILAHLDLPELDVDEVETLLNKLKAIAINTQNQRIETLYKIAEASYYKNRGRSIYLGKAQEIFTKLANQKEIEFEFYIYIVLSLCELLIVELQLVDNEEVFRDLDEYLSEVYQRAQQEEAISYLIEILLLKSKISLISDDLNKTSILLEQASLLATEQNLELYKHRVEVATEELNLEIQRLDNLVNSNRDLHERLLHANLTDYLKDVVKFLK